jgi:hypothetical protein
LEKNLAQQSQWKKVHIQIEDISNNLPKFYMWKPNKHINIMLRWGKWSKSQWDCSKGGGASWKIIDIQGKGQGDKEPQMNQGQ